MKAAATPPPEPREQMRTMTVRSTFHAAIRRIAAGRNMTIGDAIDLYIMPGLRKELAKVIRKEHAELGGES